ncbi:hypothetical protein ACFPRL_30440 [Pseudoclavibacter helvolus]
MDGGDEVAVGDREVPPGECCLVVRSELALQALRVTDRLAPGDRLADVGDGQPEAGAEVIRERVVVLG